LERWGFASLRRFAPAQPQPADSKPGNRDERRYSTYVPLRAWYYGGHGRKGRPDDRRLLAHLVALAGAPAVPLAGRERWRKRHSSEPLQRGQEIFPPGVPTVPHAIALADGCHLRRELSEAVGGKP